MLNLLLTTRGAGQNIADRFWFRLGSFGVLLVWVLKVGYLLDMYQFLLFITFIVYWDHNFKGVFVKAYTVNLWLIWSWSYIS
jgi:hypothetical protein